MRRALIVALLLALSVLPATAQTTEPSPVVDTPPIARLAVSCDGLACVLDASGSTAGSRSIASYSWSCGSAPECPSFTVAPINHHTYPAAGTYTARVRVTDRANQSSLALLTFSIEAPTATPTGTPTPTATEIPTSTPTETSTPTPTATSTSTPAPCPGVYAGVVVEHNTLTVTCVKATDQPWPNGGLVIPDWQVPP